ncbi:MAG: phenylacetic acid degradation protein PaaD [Neptuniibacter caesariensis]|uniref:Phenylacetic acid degradation protein PaaD n=1 Tax=Neptuniibacter caesariensis TaxID=207954 RepID=A0A2G6JNR7_NEPCE|nr:MAG: phenylacetic acid degradation protein PaaD [Neptuniibacter caesariensis]
MADSINYAEKYDLNDPQQLAEACAEVMLADDPLTKELKMEITKIAPDYAELTMPVQNWMTNGHDTCHGGMIFSLADSAFAFSCNSSNYPTVAAGVTIDYVSPAHCNDLLTAKASKAHQRGRTGVYDVRVENQKGELIALFRGRSHRIRGVLIPGTELPEGK